MTPDEQYAEIHQASFFTDLHTKLRNTINSMVNADINLEGEDSWLRTNVDGVAVSFRKEDDNYYLRIGVSSEGKFFYELILPSEWIS